MGGFGSGGHNRNRVTVEACARLDAAMIRRAGFFDTTEPGHAWAWRYTSRGERSITFAAQWSELGAALSVSLLLPPSCVGTDGKQVYAQRVRVSYTPCNYGQRRAWLHCPQCERRVFRLYYYPFTVDQYGHDLHILTCRHCRRLTYDQRRARGFDRLQTRCMAIASKLERRGGKSWGMWDMLPSKPRGMHWRTYERIAQQFKRANDDAQEAYVATLSRLLR